MGIDSVSIVDATVLIIIRRPTSGESKRESLHGSRRIEAKKARNTKPKIGVAQTVFLVNRVFVPCRKGAVLTKTAKMANLHSTH